MSYLKKHFRKIFDEGFDSVEKEPTLHNMNHILTSLDDLIQKAIDFYEKQISDEQIRSKIFHDECEALKIERSQLKKDSETLMAQLYDLKKELEHSKKKEDFEFLRTFRF